MIKRDIAQSSIGKSNSPTTTRLISFDEMCCLCEKYIPDGSVVLRKVENRNIICLVCLADIALVEE